MQMNSAIYLGIFIIFVVLIFKQRRSSDQTTTTQIDGTTTTTLAAFTTLPPSATTTKTPAVANYPIPIQSIQIAFPSTVHGIQFTSVQFLNGTTDVGRLNNNASIYTSGSQPHYQNSTDMINQTSTTFSNPFITDAGETGQLNAYFSKPPIVTSIVYTPHPDHTCASYGIMVSLQDIDGNVRGSTEARPPQCINGNEDVPLPDQTTFTYNIRENASSDCWVYA